MSITEWSDSILIAEMNDEPAFSEDVDALERHIDGAQDSVPDLIVDMRGVSYLNSSNIAQLLRLRKKLIAGRSRLRICSVHDSTWSILMTAGLDQVFDFTEDVSTSLASLMIGGE